VKRESQTNHYCRGFVESRIAIACLLLTTSLSAESCSLEHGTPADLVQHTIVQFGCFLSSYIRKIKFAGDVKQKLAATLSAMNPYIS
jgi:hypothetical protein